jgi:hypothetical protein
VEVNCFDSASDFMVALLGDTIDLDPIAEQKNACGCVHDNNTSFPSVTSTSIFSTSSTSITSIASTTSTASITSTTSTTMTRRAEVSIPCSC